MAKTDNQNDMVSLSDRPCGTSLRLYDGTRKNISRVVFLRCRHEGMRCSFTLKWFAVAELGAMFPYLDREGKPRAARRRGGSSGCGRNMLEAGFLAGHTTPVWRSATAVVPRPLSLRATSPPHLRRGVLLQSSSFEKVGRWDLYSLNGSRLPQRPSLDRSVCVLPGMWGMGRTLPSGGQQLDRCFRASLARQFPPDDLDTLA